MPHPAAGGRMLMGCHVTPHSVGRTGDWLDPPSVALGGEDTFNEALPGT